MGIKCNLLKCFWWGGRKIIKALEKTNNCANAFREILHCGRKKPESLLVFGIQLRVDKFMSKKVRHI